MLSGTAPFHLSDELLTAFFSTRACLSLWLMKKKMPLVANLWFHIPVTIYVSYFNLVQYVMFDLCDVDWIQWNKGWRILLWYPVSEYVEIYWIPDSVLFMWRFNGNINYSPKFWSFTRSSLTTEIHMELPFDRFPIANFWEKRIPIKSLGTMVSESK